MKEVEKLRTIFEQYKDKFELVLPLTFHNALWQVMINNVHSGKLKCFYGTMSEHGNCLALVIANESGFIPTAYFKPELSLDECEDIAYSLNHDVFGIDKNMAEHISISSMSKSFAKASTIDIQGERKYNLYYTESGKAYIVNDNYNHSLRTIDMMVEFAESMDIKLPEREDIKIEVLGGPRYKGIMSLEFTAELSEKFKSAAFKLEDKSPLYEWLQTQ